MACGQPHTGRPAESVSGALGLLLAEVEGMWRLAMGLGRLGSEEKATAARPGVQVQTRTFQQSNPPLSKSLKDREG